MPGLIERYRERLPFAAGDPVVSLGEGSTPLVPRAAHLRARRRRGLAEARGRQPDRLVQGPRHDVRGAAPPCARAPRRSSARRPATPPRAPAAYAARAGLRGAVIVPEGKIATGKLAQALMHGARVIALRGNFDQALTLVRELAAATRSRSSTRSTSSASRARRPRRFEIVEELGELDALCIPVGNAGNITAYWKGFQRARPGAAHVRLPGRRAPRRSCSAAGRASRDDRERDPDRQPGALGGGDGGDDRVARGDRRRHRRRDPRRLPPARRARGRLLRAGQRGLGRRAACARRRTARGASRACSPATA